MDSFANLYHVLSKSITLSACEKDIVRSLFVDVSFGKGDMFLRESDVCNNLGFVSKGVFRYYIQQEGEDKTYNFASEGDFICNYESFIRQVPSAKHIQAIEKATVLSISMDNLGRFYSEIKEGNLFGRIHIENVYAETVRQLISQYTEIPELRYLKFLKQFPDLSQRLPQYYIASYVGVKPQSLSRIRKRLAAKVIY